LTEKLEEFATYNDSLEEVFENKEQIEVSKFMKITKPHALAVQEWLVKFTTEIQLNKSNVSFKRKKSTTRNFWWNCRL
jgi:hypothetical protein